MQAKPDHPVSDQPAVSETKDAGVLAALVFALLAERLGTYYEHGQWLTEAQGAQLSAEWLARSRRTLPLTERRRLSAISDELAREVAASLSREAGLYTAHELSQALDPHHQSELAATLLEECRRRVLAEASQPN